MEISKYIAHPLVALTFRLEYVAQMPMIAGSIPQPFSIGWELFLPSMNQESSLHDQKLDFLCKLGPGNSPMGDVLWANDMQFGKSFMVRVTGDLGTHKTAPPATAAQPVPDKIVS